MTRQDPSALVQAGEERFATGDLSGAVELFREALRLRPNHVDAWSDLGVALFHLERTDDARAAFEEALDIDPEHAAAREGLARVVGPFGRALRFVLLPVFREPAELGENLGRLAWFLRPYRPAVESLTLVVRDGLDPASVLQTAEASFPEHLDPGAVPWLRDLAGVVDVLPERAPWRLGPALRDCDHVLVWDQGGYGALGALVQATGGRLPTSAVDVDPFAGSARIHEVPRNVAALFPARDPAIGRSRFADAVQALRSTRSVRRCWVFGGGPTIRAAHDLDLSNGFSIVCNRFIWDDALTRHVDPSFVTFMDAAFVGPSRAGEMFRERLRPWLEGGPHRWVVTFDRWAPWLEAILPASLHDRVVSAPEQSVDFPLQRFNPDLEAEWWLPDAHNVVTSVCLPLAATLADEIRFLGMDGVRPDRSYEAWGRRWEGDPEKEADATPTDPVLAALRAAHPWRTSWVSREYQEQYRVNLEESLRRVFKELEARGKRIFTVTPSWMEVMAGRELAAAAD